MSNPKFLQMLRLARLLSDTAPRRWSAVELAARLGLHRRSVYRYLLHLDPVLPVHQEGGRYWLADRCSLSDLKLDEEAT